MKYLLLLLVLWASPALAFSPQFMGAVTSTFEGGVECSTQSIYGTPLESGGDYNMSVSGRTAGDSFVLTESQVIYSISLYMGAGTSAIELRLDDDLDMTSEYIATASRPSDGAGWKELIFDPPVSLAPGTYYWTVQMLPGASFFTKSGVQTVYVSTGTPWLNNYNHNYQAYERIKVCD